MALPFGGCGGALPQGQDRRKATFLLTRFSVQGREAEERRQLYVNVMGPSR